MMASTLALTISKPPVKVAALSRHFHKYGNVFC